METTLNIGKLYRVKSIYGYPAVFFTSKDCDSTVIINDFKDGRLILVLEMFYHVKKYETVYKFLYKDKILYTSYGYILHNADIKCIKI